MSKKKKIIIISIVLSVVLVAVAVGITLFLVLRNKTPNTPQDPTQPPAPPIEEHTHSFGEWKTVQEPTCTQPGLSERTCSYDNYTEQKEVPATGHVKHIEIINFLSHNVTCSKCGEKLATDEHAWSDDNVCEICGYQLKPTENMVYSEQIDGTCTLTGLGDLEGDVTEIIIPAKYGENKVVGINNSKGLADGVDPEKIAKITAVYIPSTITTMTMNTFKGFTNLKLVYLSDNLGAISTSAFENCESLETINIPSRITRIGNNAFAGTHISSVELPETLTEIGNNVFKDCAYLTQIKLPESLEKLGTNAFDGSGINSINVPQKLLDSAAGSKGLGWFVGTNIYELLTSEEGITNDNKDSIAFMFYDSKSYKLGQSKAPEMLTILHSEDESQITITEDGFVFYSYEGETYLINYVGGEEKVVLPELEDVQYIIAKNCFKSKQSITLVTIGAGVKEIQANAFTNCSALTSVIIDDGVVTIDAEAFSNLAIDIYTNYESEALPEGWHLTKPEQTIHYKGEWQTDEDGNPQPLGE